MSIQSNLELPVSPPFSPLELITAEQRVPVDELNFIPLYVNGLFPLIRPRIQAIGMSAIRMTLNEMPFGFMRGHDGMALQGTQLTDSIILASQGTENHQWQVSVETPDPINDYDSLIFLEGISAYIGSAAKKMHQRRG